MKRRIFLQNTLTAGAGMLLSPYVEATAAAAAPKRVIVAGAGISGLCCAYELMKAGHAVTLLEASGRYGGHVFTGRDGLSDGLYADFGADRPAEIVRRACRYNIFYWLRHVVSHDQRGVQTSLFAPHDISTAMEPEPPP